MDSDKKQKFDPGGRRKTGKTLLDIALFQYKFFFHDAVKFFFFHPSFATKKPGLFSLQIKKNIAISFEIFSLAHSFPKHPFSTP